MALTVTHAKNVAIADDPKAAAAGEVLPSDWNANHTVTGVALEQAGANLTFFVSTLGSDSNNGTSALTPFRTIQHAVSVAVSFDYQSLYQCTINVADGTYHELVSVPELLYGFHLRLSPAGFIIGNPTTPANVVIQPNDGTGNNIIQFLVNSFWAIDGFTLKADQTGSSGNGAFINAISSSIQVGTMTFDTGSGQTYGEVFGANTNAGFNFYGGTTGNGNWTFIGDGARVNAFFDLVNYCRLVPANALVFNSAINLNGQTFLTSFSSSRVDFSGTTFTNPGNITGGQFGLLNEATAISFGADPATLTLPSGPFSNSTISEAVTVDGFLYARQKSGLPANTDLYQGSWGVFKDTSGGGVYLAYNDAGTIKKVAMT